MPVLEAFLYMTLIALLGHDVLGIEQAPDLKVIVGVSIGLVVVRQMVSGYLAGRREVRS